MKHLNQKGQTMIEIVFTLGIVIIGLVGILGLIMANIAGGDVSKSQIIAANLAREGVEVAREIRDSNWLACDLTSCTDWDAGLGEDDGEIDSTAIPSFNETNGVWSLKYKVKRIDESEAIVYFNSQWGVYKQDNSPPIGFKPTFFRRLLTLNEICQDADGNETILDNDETCESAPGTIKAGIQVTSQVVWTERGREHKIIAEDHLYNWK